MDYTEFVQYAVGLLKDPLTSQQMIDQTAHDCLIGICNHRDISLREGEMELDGLLHLLLTDPRYTDQSEIKRRMDSLY